LAEANRCAEIAVTSPRSGYEIWDEIFFERRKSRSAKYGDRRFGEGAWDSSPNFKAVLLALQVKRKLYFQSEQSP